MMIARRFNMSNPTPEEVRDFVVAVTGMAIADWRKGGTTYGRTGAGITDELCSACREGHARMASGIYNNVIWTMECSAMGERS